MVLISRISFANTIQCRCVLAGHGSPSSFGLWIHPLSTHISCDAWPLVKRINPAIKTFVLRLSKELLQKSFEVRNDATELELQQQERERKKAKYISKNQQSLSLDRLNKALPHLPVHRNKGTCQWCKLDFNNFVKGRGKVQQRTSWACSGCDIHLCLTENRNFFQAYHAQWQRTNR